MTPKYVSRREMLKALLAAGGGLTAAAFLPARWIKPVVESGILPAHAATSVCTVITKLYDWNSQDGCDSTGWQSYNKFCTATAPTEDQVVTDTQYDGTPYDYTYKGAGVDLYGWANPGPGFYYLEEDPSENCG
jgi:hypothetical protein